MRIFALALAVTSFSCTSSSPPAPPLCNPGHSIVSATLWAQSAAEFRAAAIQTYAAATHALDAALADRAGTTKPAAVVLDLDETALDNSGYAARSIRRGATFHFDAHWSAWVAESSAPAVPGVREFLEHARSRGVTPFYVTNRTAAMEAATRVNLEALGFPLSATEDTVLVRGERPEWSASDKTARRDHIASRYRILLLLGDDLNDFAAVRGASPEDRRKFVDATEENWGTLWFMVPNPIYGSWEGAATGPSGSPCDELQKKIDALEP